MFVSFSFAPKMNITSDKYEPTLIISVFLTVYGENTYLLYFKYEYSRHAW